MTIEKEIEDSYREFWTKREVTEQDLFSFYGCLFQSSDIRHYERWLLEANKLYDQSQSVKILQFIGKVELLLEKIYASC